MKSQFEVDPGGRWNDGKGEVASAYAALPDAEDKEEPVLPVREETEEVPELVEETDDVRISSLLSSKEETVGVSVLSLLYSLTQRENLTSVMLTGFSS